MVLLLLNGGGKVSGVVGGGRQCVLGVDGIWRRRRRRGDVDGEAVGGNPVLVVSAAAAGVLDKVPDFGLYGAAALLSLGDHGGPRGVAQGAVQGVGHEGQRARLSGHLRTLKNVV